MSISLRSLCKRAGDPRQELARQILNVGLAGLGTGAAARAVMGFRNLGRPPVETPFVSPGPSAVRIPIPMAAATTPEEEEKLAEGPALLDQAASQLAKVLPAGQWSREAVSIPGTVLTAGAGLAGGWKLTDWLLDRQRKAQLQDELTTAQTDYHDALTSQYRQPKTAAEGNPGQLLDDLFDGFGKDASWPAKGLGVYTLAAAILGGGSAYGAYNWTKNRSDAALLAKAQKQRAKQLWNRVPQPVYAVPEPFTVAAQPAMAG